MATLRKWLDQFATQYGTPIAYVIGGESSWGEYDLELWPEVQRNVVLTSPPPPDVLNHEFDDGYGAPGCPAVYAWSDSHVFLIDCYDGATGWVAVPRHPSDGQPNMPGGG